MDDKPNDGRISLLPPGKIRRSPYQVRREEEPNQELVASVATHGLINPITVRVVADGWELIAGHRRLAAWILARGGEPVPALVVEADDMTAEDLLVSENFFRKDLTLVEEAVSVAQLRAHGRTVEQVATVVRKSERWVYRRLAIGTLAEPWRTFLHAWNATYDEAVNIARLPASVQTAAWTKMLSDIADYCDYRARKGNEDDARHRDAFILSLERKSGDKAAFCETMSKCSPDDRLASPDVAADYIGDWMSFDLDKFLRTQRIISKNFCEFDCSFCAGCTKRSDVAPSLLDADDPVRTLPQCLDPDCYARKVEKNRAETPDEADDETSSSPGEPLEAPGRGKGNSGEGSDQTASARAAEPLLQKTGGASPGNAATSSAPPREKQENADRPGVSGSGETRGGAGPLSEADVGVRMGVVWTVAQLLHGDKLEDILPEVANLRSETVRRGGWLASVRENALPRLSRNQEAARAALAGVERMW